MKKESSANEKESSANEKESSANEKESSEVEARDAVRHMLELKKRVESQYVSLLHSTLWNLRFARRTIVE